MEDQIVLELKTAHLLKRQTETDEDILYSVSKYYRKKKEDYALHDNKREYES